MGFIEDAIVVVGMTLGACLGLAVVCLLALYAFRTMRGLRGERHAEPVPTDLRHVGAALLIPAGVVAGLTAQGAGWIAILVSGLVTAPVGVGMALLVVPPWKDSAHGPWVGGAVFIGIATICLGVAVVIRQS